MAERSFEELKEAIDRMHEEFERARMGLGGEIGTAAVDVAEWDGEFVVVIDLPGFEVEDIDLRVTDHTLHIDAEHKAEHEPEVERYLRRERAHESVSRTVTLPEDVEETEVSATYEHGVLTVVLPKATHEMVEEAHPIEVE